MSVVMEEAPPGRTKRPPGRPRVEERVKAQYYVHPVFSEQDIEDMDSIRGAMPRGAFVRNATRAYITALRQVQQQLDALMTELVQEDDRVS